MDPFKAIEQLREHRARPQRETTMDGVIRSIADSARRTHKKLGSMIELWEQLVPAEIASHTAVVGLTRGVLHVHVDSASTAYQLDRLLREGLETQLRDTYRGTLVRVRTKIGPLEDA
ncbi:MAG TPA: DUF721 domain-containing protein [Phycisphaerales bacterium]|nr:DUF721 domain-containing protein [Phycisphaerales bacterium]HRQ76834.1 DUF721 domain-containing protein [Phycisphaerales bacterium]